MFNRINKTKTWFKLQDNITNLGKYIQAIILILLATAIIQGCGHVRNNYFNERLPKTRTQSDADNLKDQRKVNTLTQPKGRFSDTTVIEVKTGEEDQNILTEYRKAVAQFDIENYDQAAEVFQKLASTLDKTDSLYFECQFYNSECKVATDNLKPARLILEEILNSSSVPAPVLEKTIVRLGQLYCVENKKESAEKLFERLHTEFPGSIYLPVANCEAVKPKEK